MEVILHRDIPCGWCGMGEIVELAGIFFAEGRFTNLPSFVSMCAGLYTDVNGPASVSLVLECNTTHFLWTVVIDAEDPYNYQYYFGIRCFDANNSQVSGIQYVTV